MCRTTLRLVTCQEVTSQSEKAWQLVCFRVLNHSNRAGTAVASIVKFHPSPIVSTISVVSLAQFNLAPFMKC